MSRQTTKTAATATAAVPAATVAVDPVAKAPRKKAASKADAVVATPAVVPVAAPAAAKAPRKKAASKADAVVAPSTTDDVQSGDDVQVADKAPADAVAQHFAEISKLFALVKAEWKLQKKESDKNAKALKKISDKKAKKDSTPRKPSGFVKPTPISNDLADFLGKEHGSKMARTEVTKEMTAYIREHGLQAKENGRKILADAKMLKLLGITETTELSYFNLQKHIKKHFLPQTPEVAAAVAV